MLKNHSTKSQRELTECLHDGLSLSITASFGVADFNAQMNELKDLIKLADMALYKAKKSGRNIDCQMQEIPKENDNEALNIIQTVN